MRWSWGYKKQRRSSGIIIISVLLTFLLNKNKKDWFIQNTAYIGLGSNKGDKINYLRKSINELNRSENCSVLEASSVYETKPYGYKDQDNFFNAAIKIKTEFSVIRLLEILKSIEKDLGRSRTQKWGPREIDLDLLFFNDLIFSNERVTIPHKEIAKRDFVLVPLCEIAPDFIYFFYPYLEKIGVK